VSDYRVSGSTHNRPPAADTKTAGSNTQPKTGTLKNLRAIALNARSVNQTAREKMGAVFKAADYLSNKKVKEASREKNEKLSKAKDLAEKYAARLPSKNAGELLQQLFQSLKGLKEFTSDDILKEVRQFFPDPSDQYEALGFAAEAFALEGELDKADFLQEAQDKLLKRQGPEVRAGINILPEALKASEADLAPVQDLRDFYRETILISQAILSIFRSIKAEYGPQKLDQGLDYLIRATTADLNAQGPSIEKGHLKAIIDNFYAVGVLNRMQEQFTALLNRMHDQYDKGISKDPEALMESVLKLVESLKVDIAQVQQLVTKTNIHTLAPRIDFLTHLYEQLRLIPLKVYPGSLTRTQLLESTQKELDRSIALEEETLGEAH
jgi:type III secretion protein W